MTWKFFHTSLGSVQVTPMNPSHLTHVLLKWHWVVLPSLGQLSCPSEYYLGLYFYSPGSCYRIKVSPSIWNLLDSRDLVQVDGPLDSLVATCWVIKDEEELRDMQERDSGISLFKLLNSALEFVEKTTTFPSLMLFICLRSEQNICCIAAVGALLEYWQSQVHELSEELRDGALGHSCLHWVLALALSLVPKHSSSSHGGGGGVVNLISLLVQIPCRLKSFLCSYFLGKSCFHAHVICTWLPLQHGCHCVLFFHHLLYYK